MWENMREFWSRPFAADMSAVDWFLFIGLLIVIVALWNLILFNLKEAVS